MVGERPIKEWNPSTLERKPVAKAPAEDRSDAQIWKRGYRKGTRSLVVHAENDAN